MDAATVRSATWTELDLPAAHDQGYAIWMAKEAPGIARIAKEGRLYWFFGGQAYGNIDTMVDVYNLRFALPEHAVRAALAAQLGVAPSAIPEDTGLLTGMRKALAAFLVATS
jgi:hypothetical protein